MRRRFLIAPILMIGIVLAPAYAGWLEDAKGALEGMGKKGADKAADTAMEGAKGKAKGSAPQEGAQKETGKEASAKAAAPATEPATPSRWSSPRVGTSSGASRRPASRIPSTIRASSCG